jgi:hypothetical protein
MWGRLDGCEHVAQVLLDPGRLQALASTDRDRLVEGLGAVVNDPGAVRAAVDAIAAAGGAKDVEAPVEALRALVTRRAQLDVLREELPVIASEVAAGDPKTQDAARPWTERFASAGDDPARLWAAFEAYTLGTDSADEVLRSHVGKEGRRDAVLSAVRALHADTTLPPIVGTLSGVAERALRAYGASVDFTEDVREHVSDLTDDVRDQLSEVRDWLRGHWRRE